MSDGGAAELLQSGELKGKAPSSLSFSFSFSSEDLFLCMWQNWAWKIDLVVQNGLSHLFFFTDFANSPMLLNWG